MSRAPALAARVEQYLAERRRLGFDLRSMRYGLESLVEHVSRTRHRGALTVEVMAAWARQARQGAGTRATWARRLRLRPGRCRLPKRSNKYLSARESLSAGCLRPESCLFFESPEESLLLRTWRRPVYDIRDHRALRRSAGDVGEFRRAV